jgi:hypothetical protein
MTVSSSLMKIWYFLVIVISLSSLSLASAYEITSDSENVIVYRDVSELVFIKGLVPEDIFELYPPILVTVTEPDGRNYVLEYPVTEKRQYNFPMRFDEFSLEGIHTLEISYRTKIFHTVSITVSKTSEFKTSPNSLILDSSSKFFSNPEISSIGDLYYVNLNVIDSNSYDHVRLSVKNHCAGISEIHSKDYRLTKNSLIEFDFKQLSFNKPDSCKLIFSLYDVGLDLIDYFYSEYDINFETIVIDEQITRVIPNWTKTLVTFWLEDKISDITFSNSLNHLVNSNIIQINASGKSKIDVFNFPSWFKQNSKFWVEGSISDYKYLIGLETLQQR